MDDETDSDVVYIHSLYSDKECTYPMYMYILVFLSVLTRWPNKIETKVNQL